MKNFTPLFILILLFNCKDSEENLTQTTTNSNNFIENFDTQTHVDKFWEDASQNDSPMNYGIENGSFKITTRANVVDRVKIKTIKEDYSLGSYSWKIYTSERTIGDQNSIGAFLYLNDSKELDFEIGSGKLELRNELNAQADDLVVFCTSQNLPAISNAFLIKHNQWHTFKLELTIDQATQNYKAEWFIDNNSLQTQVLEYGLENKFGAYCSLENLGFIGDQLPSQEYSVLFDSFVFEE